LHCCLFVKVLCCFSVSRNSDILSLRFSHVNNFFLTFFASFFRRFYAPQKSSTVFSRWSFIITFLFMFVNYHFYLFAEFFSHTIRIGDSVIRQLRMLHKKSHKWVHLIYIEKNVIFCDLYQPLRALSGNIIFCNDNKQRPYNNHAFCNSDNHS